MEASSYSVAQAHRPTLGNGMGVVLCNNNPTMNTPDTRPHKNSYWITEGTLMAGEYPGHPAAGNARERVARHIEAGISFFLDLTEEDELDPYTRFLPERHPVSGLPMVHKRMPIRDVDVPKSAAEMTAILDSIDGALKEGHVVYVHCWGGRGRTGTVVGCHFVRGGSTGREALLQVAELWKNVEKSAWKPTSPETDEQRSFVLAWRAASAK